MRSDEWKILVLGFMSMNDRIFAETSPFEFSKYTESKYTESKYTESKVVRESPPETACIGNCSHRIDSS